MANIKDKILKMKMKWHDSEDTNIKAIEGSSGKFDLMLNDLLVGTLVYSNDVWTFCYSQEFKQQNQYEPLINFPSIDAEYKNKQLWPFFATRLPGNAQLKEELEKKDIISLLKKYGRHVITNPFELIEA